MSSSITEKILYGQFFTVTNPFANEAFIRWFKSVPDYKSQVLLEPFAGANNIVTMLRDLGFENKWACFDIAPVNDPEVNATAREIPVLARDTLSDYPRNYEVAITNPPYLAKNSATAKGLPYVGGPYADVYLQCVATMLQNTPFVAAIIPESFITQGLFHERLSTVISLTCRMFEDTEVPVCLALFSPSDSKNFSNDFEIWSGNKKIGDYSALRAWVEPYCGPRQGWEFNNPTGLIGLKAVDSQHKASISFGLHKSDIPAKSVNQSSRSNTRIHLDGLSEELANSVIARANKLLDERRELTQDVFMTSFKGLRKDGKYRRRLDFKQARELLDRAYFELTCQEQK